MYEEIEFGSRGNNVQLYPMSAFANPASIHLLNEIIISEFCWIHGGLRTVIGNFIHISCFCSVAGGGLCILEDFVGLSAGSRIITGSEMIRGEGLTNPTIPRELRAVSRSFVHLERHAFLASAVVVYPGVTIGEGAVIGSNSIVTKDVAPWTINIGAPARPVGTRPSEKIKRLEKQAYALRGVTPFDSTPLLPLKKKQDVIPQD